MDTLPSSVSCLQAPNYTLFHRKSNDFSRFNPPHTHTTTTTTTTTTTSHQNLIIVSSSNKQPSFSTSKLSNNNSHFLRLPQSLSSSSSSPKQAPLVHRNAATGYAAALIDVAQCTNSMHSMEKDVKRFFKLLTNHQLQEFMADPRVNQSEKGQVFKEIADKGKINKHLVVLVKMLVHNAKLEMVTQVLMEFQTLFDKLSGTNRFFVPS